MIDTMGIGRISYELAKWQSAEFANRLNNILWTYDLIFDKF